MDAKVIQPFSSKFETVRVQISREAFENSGIGIFSSEQIPFAGRTGPDFAQNLVTLLVFRVKALQKQGRSFPDGIHIYELGAGTGLLAKRVLDLLKSNHKHLYNKIVLHISDISKPMILELKSSNVFAIHKRHVVFETIDFIKPKFTHKPLLVYFTNLLDALPYHRQIQIQDGQIFEFQIQTALKKDAQIIDTNSYPPKVLEEKDIAKLILEPSSKRRLILAFQILTVLKEEGKFTPIDNVPNISKEELSDIKNLVISLNKTEPFNYSYPVKIALRTIIGSLETGGFVFFSDFGVTSEGRGPDLQLEIGRVMAFSVDFPSLMQYAQTGGKTYLTSNPQGYPQEMLIDTLPDDKQLEILFKKTSVTDLRKQVNDFLDKAKLALSENGQITPLYNSLPEEIKSDYVLLNSLALLLHRANFYKEADFYADILFQKYGHAVGIIYNLVKGKAAQEERNFKLAEEFYKQAIKSQKGFLAYGYLGELCWQQGRFLEYIGILKEYLKHTRSRDYLRIMFSIAQAEGKLYGEPTAKKTLTELINTGQKLKTLSEPEKEILKQAETALVL